MFKLNLIYASNAKFVQNHPLVAVCVAGAGGIGEYIVRALATAYGQHNPDDNPPQNQNQRRLRIYIVGRNARAASDLISECKQLYTNGEFIFVQADDLTLLRNVDAVCKEIIRLEEEKAARGLSEARIDLLYMTQGRVMLGPRRETAEGLDKTMALLYYSRIRLITSLLPLLLHSALPSAHIISVYAAGHEANLFPADLSLRETYSFANARSHVTYMTTLTFERLADEYKGRLSLVHVFPGIVLTPGYQDPELPMWLKVTLGLAGPFLKAFLAMDKGECGARMMFLGSERFPAAAVGGSGRGAVDSDEAGLKSVLDGGVQQVARGTDGVVGGGAYAVNQVGETIDISKAYERVGKEELKVKVWEHTMAAFETIESGNMFSG